MDAAVPLQCPANVNIDVSSLSSTSVELTWDAVSENADTVLGFFIGYRVNSSLNDVSSHTFAETGSLL